MDYTAIGHTVGLAQRMEQLAEPGKAYLTEHTAKLAEGYFELRTSASSRSRARAARCGLRAGGRRRGPHAPRCLAGAGLSGSSAATTEMAALEEALERAPTGQGRRVGVVGEAGIGKSRLCHEFAERCRARGIAIYEA